MARVDEAEFERLVAPYLRELHAHCYRMLGSLHDTEEAMQEAMLRVHQPRFARIYAEEGCIEALRIVERRAHGHVVGAREQRWIDSGAFEVCGGVADDGLDAIRDVFPECVDVSRPRKTPGHSDDGSFGAVHRHPVWLVATALPMGAGRS